MDCAETYGSGMVEHFVAEVTLRGLQDIPWYKVCWCIASPQVRIRVKCCLNVTTYVAVGCNSNNN